MIKPHLKRSPSMLLLMILFSTSCSHPKDCMETHISALKQELKGELEFYADLSNLFCDIVAYTDGIDPTVKAVSRAKAQLTSMAIGANALHQKSQQIEAYSDESAQLLQEVNAWLDKIATNSTQFVQLIEYKQQNERINPNLGHYLDDFWGSVEGYNTYKTNQAAIDQQGQELVKEFGIMDSELKYFITKAESLGEKIKGHITQTIRSHHCGDGLFTGLQIDQEFIHDEYIATRVALKSGLDAYSPHLTPCQSKSLEGFVDNLNVEDLLYESLDQER